MDRRQPAAIGASALSEGWSLPAAAGVSLGTRIGLAGSNTLAKEAPADPIAAARRWLHGSRRGKELHPLLRERADSALDVAEDHVRTMQGLTARITAQVERTGTADLTQVAHVQDLAATLQDFSERLRRLLDPDSDDSDVVERLDRGLHAAASGGLPALVSAL